MSEKVNYYLELCSEFITEINRAYYEEEPYQEDDLFSRICDEFPEIKEDEELTLEDINELKAELYDNYIEEYEFWREWYGVPEPEEDLDASLYDEDDDLEDDIDKDSDEILVTLHNADRQIRDIKDYSSEYNFKAKLIDSYKSAHPDDHGLRIDVWELYGKRENLLGFFKDYSIPYWDTDIVTVGPRFSHEKFGEMDESLREDTKSDLNLNEIVSEVYNGDVFTAISYFLYRGNISEAKRLFAALKEAASEMSSTYYVQLCEKALEKL